MGNVKYIETPELMWQYFSDYAAHIKGDPILVKDWVGKDAETVEREKERPLTMVGFLCYLDDQNIITDATDYFENKDNRYSGYIRVCSRITRNIKKDQIEGGMAGIYNPSITQRLNGLTDKSEVAHSGEIKTDYDLTHISKEALKELLNAAPTNKSS